MDIPNLCAKAATSDMNSDLDCSDVDFDSDSQNKATAQDVDEKSVTQNRDEACEKLKKLFFASRVSTDSTETDCSSIDFKPSQTTVASESNLSLSDDNKSAIMECDSSKTKSDGFCIVQNLVSSTDDINVATKQHDTVDLIAKCVPNNDCLPLSVADVVNTKIALESQENST